MYGEGPANNRRESGLNIGCSIGIWKRRVMTDFCQVAKWNGAALGVAIRAVIPFPTHVGAAFSLGTREQSKSVCGRTDSGEPMMSKRWLVADSRREPGGVRGDQSGSENRLDGSGRLHRCSLNRLEDCEMKNPVKELEAWTDRWLSDVKRVKESYNLWGDWDPTKGRLEACQHSW